MLTRKQRPKQHATQGNTEQLFDYFFSNKYIFGGKLVSSLLFMSYTCFIEI